jgi:hypothetical protein
MVPVNQEHPMALLSTLARQSRPAPRTERGVALLAGTAALVFGLTGVGMFEGRVVYPSWLDLSAFPDFASYHTDYGRALLPWLPAPLAVATVLNAVLLRRRPQAVPLSAVVATLVGQLAVVGVTGALAIPIQLELGTEGHSPEEIRDLVNRLMDINVLREVPGLAIAGTFGWMLVRVLRHPRPDQG